MLNNQYLLTNFQSKGIWIQFSSPYMPQQNGKVEHVICISITFLACIYSKHPSQQNFGSMLFMLLLFILSIFFSLPLFLLKLLLKSYLVSFPHTTIFVFLDASVIQTHLSLLLTNSRLIPLHMRTLDLCQITEIIGVLISSLSDSLLLVMWFLMNITFCMLIFSPHPHL